MAVRRKRKKKTTTTPRRKRFSASLVREIWGMVIIVFGVLVLMSLAGNLGIAGEYMTVFFANFLGQGIWIFPFVLIVFGAFLFASKLKSISFSSLFGIVLFFFALEGLFHTLEVPLSQASVPSREGGGMIGVAASVFFRMILGDMGAKVVLCMLLVIGFLLTFRLSLLQIFSWIYDGIMFLVGEVSEETKKALESKLKQSKKENIDEKDSTTKQSNLEKNVKKEIEPITVNSESIDPSVFEIKRGDSVGEESVPKQQKLEKEEPKTLSRPEDQDFSDWTPPTLDLLDNGSSDVHVPDEELTEIGNKIAEKLGYFNIGVTMKSAFVGPTVTQFALEPDETVKLSKITGLKSELALALSAESVRIEAPIPGKNLVGIETPNPKRSTVLMKEILKSNAFASANGSLRLCLGKDVSGEAIVESLDEMPHLLIAGSTGSGKSVGMNAFLVSMLYENSPSDLRFIMVDPKRVELMPYEGIPHLLTPVITEADKALSALRWCVSEMMRRLDEFSKVGARNIAEYNETMKDRQKEEDEKIAQDPTADFHEWKTIPKIVIVIDELADLMMREHKKETEAMICRIAQMARAVGMHLVIATQRPSVDVITGLIKANIPTRIAFTVTSAIDSRTVLDSIGAEDLLGRGDMLFTNPRISKPKRIQGIYISGKEIERVVNHLKINISDKDFFSDHISLDDAPDTVDVPGFTAKPQTDGGDAKLEEAVEVVRETGKASASLLQRRLSIGYARAARVLDEMEELGYIGPSKGAKARDIFL